MPAAGVLGDEDVAVGSEPAQSLDGDTNYLGSLWFLPHECVHESDSLWRCARPQ